ncbi:hypothetical protein L1I30_03645 [Gillisia sp. M10.2A]|uniref:DUF5017 domain-containing protein n=1 Tax=Gillisia lutea TaxID=2909668 RepID=A0ABS9EFX5_9FLAO|nr:hypothetical protein [Gillisia lutea]MCF4100754.1 hypothetical protein [Gillisia lutea]
MNKTIYYLAIFLGLALTSCEPMEEIHDDINNKLDNSLAVGNIEYTLTSDDYSDLGLSFPNFNSVEDAKNLLPAFLEDNYPYYGAESQANLTFDIYAPQSTEKSLIVYTVTTEDYDSNPETAQYDNFDDESQIYALLNKKFPNLANRTLVSLTYKYYDGQAKTLNNGFLYVNGEFMLIEGLTDAEYIATGESYPNFSSADEANQKLPIFLKEKYKYRTFEAGDLVSVLYKLYTKDVQDVDGDGSTEDNATYSYVKYFSWNGEAFEPYNNTVAQTLQFGNIDGTWIPDNTIRYTLSGTDFAYIGTQFADAYPTPASSAGRYGNFDRRSSNTAYWSDAMILEAVNAVLDNINPNAEEGQKYVITYDVYNGSNTTEVISVIKEGGSWILN